jgi:hypothetical protein
MGRANVRSIIGPVMCIILFAAPSAAQWANGIDTASRPVVTDPIAETAVPEVPQPASVDGVRRVRLTTTVVGQGSIQIDPVKAWYRPGETVTLTAAHATGWLFANWSGGATGAANPLTLTLNSNLTVTATFVADLTPVEITNVQIVTESTSATITWSTNSPATSRLAYGVTTTYEAGTVSDAQMTIAHVIALSGLTADTTYYFEVYSAEESGNAATAGGQTFRTAPSGPPVSNIVSDDFNTCAVDTSLWQVVNPLGDATFTITGVGSADARVAITVPAGTDHDVWVDGNRAPRLMQPADDTDFMLRVKFDAPILGAYQMQGIIVQQDATHFLRFDFYSTSDRNWIYAAMLDGGTVIVRQQMNIAIGAPLYMSVTRAGDQWTQQYSYDGTNWLPSVTFAQPLTVTAIGPFIGNVGAAFTGLIDYFFNAADPIVPEDGPPVGTPAATLTVNVTGNGSVAVNPDRDVYYCGETITLNALPALGWKLSSWSGALSGANPVRTLSMTASRTVGATFVVDNQPPIISNIGVAALDTSVRVTWTTNKPATGSVAYGATTNYELGAVSTNGYGTSHALVLAGLAPATAYHCRITSVDALGAAVSSNDVPFTTTVVGGFVSDDFNAYNLNPNLWTIVNPLDDAGFALVGTNTPNARLQISVPAGVEHFVEASGITAPHVLQAVGDVDFTVVVKYDSLPAAQYQEQGVLVQQDSDTYLRFDFYSDGTSLKLYGAIYHDGSRQVIRNGTVPNSAPAYLRLNRAGDHWIVDYSFNGTSWTPAAAFDYPMTVAAAGPFVGNEGTSAPAFTALIDYFFNAASPIVPEDGAIVTDTFPPNLIGLQTSAGEDNVVLQWTTDEPSRHVVAYGTTLAYESGSLSDPALQTSHLQIVTGLQPSTAYHLRITSTDAAGNTGASDDLLVTTSAAGSSSAPAVNIWYGQTQEFGALGTPQPWVNVLGHASDPQGLSAVTYSLNGGAQRPLSITPQQSARLAQAGDFNVELDVNELLPGTNELLVTATDSLGNQRLTPVNLLNSAGPVWPLPYTADWSMATQINDVAQVVDGLWTLEPGGLRTVVTGYDRLVAIGDESWTDYEVTVPLTVHAVNTNGYAYPSNGSAVGVVMHWPGHTSWNSQQPRLGYYPLGAIGWFRWAPDNHRFWIDGNNGVPLAYEATLPFVVGVPYTFRMRVAAGSGVVNYQLKVWQTSQPEPATWTMSGQQAAANDPGHGCLLLLAHNVDVTFGTVSVVPGPFSPGTLLSSDVAPSLGGTETVPSAAAPEPVTNLDAVREPLSAGALR